MRQSRGVPLYGVKGEYMHKLTRAALVACAAMVLAAPSGGALAQTARSTGSGQAYPSKPIRLIVAFPPGGSTDIIARLVGQQLGDRLGQQVIIDNRGGAGGTIGTEIAAKATPDGHTLTMGTTSTHVIAPAAYASVKYDPIKDFVPITLVAEGIRCVGQISAREIQFRFGGHWFHHPVGDGDAEDGGRYRHCARTL